MLHASSPLTLARARVERAVDALDKARIAAPYPGARTPAKTAALREFQAAWKALGVLTVEADPASPVWSPA